MEKVFARDWFSSRLSVAVARTSQSPFPLAASLSQNYTNKKKMKKIIILIFSLFIFKNAYAQQSNGLKISKQSEQYSENDSIP